jgi:hypothetical protein
MVFSGQAKNLEQSPKKSDEEGFNMIEWPEQIPHDLQHGFESNRKDDWRLTLQKWAKAHSLKLKIQWFRGLETAMAELHDRHFDASPADHWYLIRHWLTRHDVPVPSNLLIQHRHQAAAE